MRASILPASVLAILLTNTAFATSITYSGFSATDGLTLSGSATTTTTADGTVLELVPATFAEAGSAFSSTTINASDFSTSFQFRMTNPGGVADTAGQVGADGLTFIVQSVSSSIGSSGSGAGYEGIPNSVGIKFDTFMNGWNWGNLGDPSSNFVGIYTNGSVQTTASTPTKTVTPNFDDGNLWTVWIDYNGTNLSVYADETGIRPADPLVTEALDLPSLLGQNTAYVGFGASTGAAWENDTIVDWKYNDSYNPIVVPPGNTVPEPASLAVFGTGLLLMVRFARRRDLPASA